jgi:hypothetical protein
MQLWHAISSRDHAQYYVSNWDVGENAEPSASPSSSDGDESEPPTEHLADPASHILQGFDMRTASLSQSPKPEAAPHRRQAAARRKGDSFSFRSEMFYTVETVRE